MKKKILILAVTIVSLSISVKKSESSFNLFAQQKNNVNKYAPRMDEFENIDKEINLSSVRDGVNNVLTETANQFSELSRALAASGIDISDLKKYIIESNKETPAQPQQQNPQKKNIQQKTPQQAQTKKSGSTSQKNVSYQTLIEAARRTTEQRKELIRYGLTLRGTKYKLGGTDPSTGLDCSAFVQYSVRNGIHKNLPRTAEEMYEFTKPVNESEREPGDLVFFKENPYGRVTHVGIYLGKYKGEGRLHGRQIFLNSASAGPNTGVVLSALDEPYWKRTYYSTGRFLPHVRRLVKEAKARQPAKK